MIKTSITAFKAIEKVKGLEGLIWGSIMEHFKLGNPKVDEDGNRFFAVNLAEDICIQNGDGDNAPISKIYITKSNKLSVKLDSPLGETLFVQRGSVSTIDLAYILKAIESTYGE